MNHSPESLLGLATTCVRRAVDQSKPASQAGMENCQQLLTEAVDHVRELQAGLADLPADSREGIRQSLATLRQEIAGAVRAMDSGATFYRVLAVSCGVGSSNYDSAGRVVSEGTALASDLQV